MMINVEKLRRMQASAPLRLRKKDTPAPIPRRPWILDFDGTITTKDTISTLANFAISRDESQRDQKQKEWDDILNAYSADSQWHTAGYRPHETWRRTLVDEIRYHRDLRDIEIRSFDRISKSEIFKGIEFRDWNDFGVEAVRDGLVKTREGFDEFAQKMGDISAGGLFWVVVSANFSKDFISGVLKGKNIEKLFVLANTARPDGILEGFVPRRDAPRAMIITSDVKLAAMNKMLGYWRGREGANLNTPVYVGDSGTDIECLMDPRTIGIVMSEDGEGSLMKILRRISVTILPVAEFDESKMEKKTSVLWARNFTEIVNSPLLKAA